ncbi:AraC family transcriptional regulator [Leucothrix arctica]|uniref:AraC family transcriptional regulator n=1 Tax=Leucothrix arctica TaxID=1481894 RepID=A0A317CEZ8_9GAMM|nr:AraC family transcriptional regulator [Leucothrix arctica]PWQ95943.1 AraC family transcriptional regulator [Leucothrix arctica]
MHNNQSNYSYAKDLGGLELLHARYTNQTFSKHVHDGFCIGVIESGAQRFYRSGSNHLAAKNSIIIVNADQVHDGCRATDNGWSYRAIYPKPEKLMAISSEFQNSSDTAIPWFPDAVVHDPIVANQLRQLYTCLQQSTNQLLRESMYLASMTSLISRHSKQRTRLQTLGKEPKAVQLVREYIDSHFDQNISLAALASLSGLSPFYLARLFAKTTGLPPHAYQNQRQIHSAKQQLLSGVKPSEVAASCGFTDQSHFNRHFKKAFGITPGAYQRMMKISH